MVRISKSSTTFPAEKFFRLGTAMILLWTTAGYPALAQTPAPPPSQEQAPMDQDAQGYTMTDLQYILGPIALYPDPLLALIFPASSFPDQLAEAKKWIDANPQAVSNNDFTAVDTMPWDPSVQALTRFPDVIDMLTEKPDWTESIAWAFSVQHDDVSAAIQLLRAQAKDAGNLQSTPQQVVTSQPSDAGGPPVIYIAPADPERIYVPAYDPGVVFASAVAGALFFGTAVFVGSSWNNRWGWNNRSWNQVWITPPHGWRPMPGRPGRPPVWRPDNRPGWGPGRPPGRPNVRPDRPGGIRPDRPGFQPGPGGPGGVRPERPNIRPGGPGGRPELPTIRPDRPNMRPGGPGGRPSLPTGRPDRPGAGVPNRPAVRPGFNPSGPGVQPNRPQRPNPAARPSARPQVRPPQQARPQVRPPQQARPQMRPPQARPQMRPPQARPQMRPPQARPQVRPQARPQVRPAPGRPRPQGR